MRTEFLKKPVNEKDHRIGALNSPVVLVEYGCYECIRCARADEWLQKLTQEFKGELCYVFRHFPLTDIHPNAALAAMAAESAAEKNKFWEMHHLLYENSRFLSGEFIIKLAGKIGFDTDQFTHDLDRNDLMDVICTDIVGGEESGVTDPPAFFLNNKLIEGKIDYQMMKDKINRELGNRNIGQTSAF